MCTSASRKPIFFDMAHSNNAARIRIWLQHKGLQDQIETRTVTYPDLSSESFVAVNPMKKVPAFIQADGSCIFESFVILEYLESKYSDTGPVFRPSNHEEAAHMNLLIRMHDLYIASPNCTQPGFSHTQGAMYLAPYETKHCAAARAMDRPTRAAKIAELWKQMKFLEDTSLCSPHLCGEQLTLADFTWFPTCVFIEYMLPRVFGWDILANTAEFPKLAAWYKHACEDPVMAGVRETIWQHWVAMDREGQFDSIRGELEDQSFKWVYP